MTMPSLNRPDLLRDSCMVGGDWITADDRSTISVSNPATGQIVARVPRMGAAETARAIAAAESAGTVWVARTGKERAAILRRWFEMMRDNRNDLGAILTAEQGKPWDEAKGEIDYAASFIEWFGEEAKGNGQNLGVRLPFVRQPIAHRGQQLL